MVMTSRTARGTRYAASPNAPPLVLIMGLAAPMIAWDEDFCGRLAARGYYVVRFDNPRRRTVDPPRDFRGAECDSRLDGSRTGPAVAAHAV
jgi:pimeloyl-ACP methyl ester carboxylesterase